MNRDTFIHFTYWWRDGILFSWIQIADTGSEVPLIEPPLGPKISGLNSSTSYSMQW